MSRANYDITPVCRQAGFDKLSVTNQYVIQSLSKDDRYLNIDVTPVCRQAGFDKLNVTINMKFKFIWSTE